MVFMQARPWWREVIIIRRCGESGRLACKVLPRGMRSTSPAARHHCFKNEDFTLTKVGNFLLKGKQTKIAIYKCGWRQIPRSDWRESNRMFLCMVVRRQKLEFLIYSMRQHRYIIYFLFLNYLRYFLADKEVLALLSLRLQLILDARIAIPAGLGILTLVAVFLAIRTKNHFPIWLSAF